MTTALSVFLTQVNILVPANTDTLPTASRQACIKQAVELYSMDEPDLEVDDVTGDGGKYYPIATTLTSWSEGRSIIVGIEYPAATIASDEGPLYLEPDDWREDYWAADVRYLYLPNHTPAATETMRITYTVPYEWSAVADPLTTTPPGRFYAICELAACFCCRVIATKYSEIGDSTYGADSAAHVGKAQEFAARADAYCDAYKHAMGLDADKQAPGPAGVFVDVNTVPEWPTGRQYIFRGRR